MKILRLGTKDETINVYQKTCGGCNTVFEYRETDVHEKYWNDGRNECGTAFWVKCPKCAVRLNHRGQKPVGTVKKGCRKVNYTR